MSTQDNKGPFGVAPEGRAEYYQEGMSPDQLRIVTMLHDARMVSDFMIVCSKALNWNMIDVKEYARLMQVVSNTAILRTAECRDTLLKTIVSEFYK